jgi:hyaluronoglucosaminidase
MRLLRLTGDEAMTPELGIIEGFYGRPWSWSDRAEAISFLAPHGYTFYLYAPKADAYLRRRWREPHPAGNVESLHDLAQHCAAAGVRFGVGLSPYGTHERFGELDREALRRKLAFVDELGARDLGILFDDMRGDIADLAERQARIVDWVAARSGAERIVVCPSYYTDDPVLDRVFGPRPARYLETLGQLLDASVEIFWTGEEVCSRELSAAHLGRVAEQIGRRPFVWDNYPVNDGQRMSAYLHLRAFTGRPATIGGLVAAHGINPALQPTLTRVPALTLVESYRLGGDYAYGAAFRRAARTVLGETLGDMLWQDLLVLQDVGLDRLGDREAALRERYGPLAHPAAREIIAWLDGDYRITDEIVHTQ